MRVGSVGKFSVEVHGLHSGIARIRLFHPYGRGETFQELELEEAKKLAELLLEAIQKAPEAIEEARKWHEKFQRKP